MRRYGWVLTGKPEGRRFRRSGGENRLQRSVGFGIRDPDVNGWGRGESFRRKRFWVVIHRLFDLVRGV
jgi:hypothetical protein